MLEHFAREVDKEKAAGAHLRFGLQDGTIVPQCREVACQLIEVVAQKVRAVFIGDGFQNQAEVEQMFGERKLLRSRESDW